MATHARGPGGQALRKLLKADSHEAAMGWFPSSRYPDGTPVAYIASIHEYGVATKGIPPRLGLRALDREKQGEWRKAALVAAKLALAKGTGEQGMMEVMAQVMSGDMRRHISQVRSPPLKPATIAARLRRLSPSGKKRALKVYVQQQQEGRPTTLDKPLVDTRLLLNSLQGVARPSA